VWRTIKRFVRLIFASPQLRKKRSFSARWHTAFSNLRIAVEPGLRQNNRKLVCKTTLPFSGNATPITSQVDGLQYVVIVADGWKGLHLNNRDPNLEYVAFALPR
jgi:hypothetical protein